MKQGMTALTKKNLLLMWISGTMVSAGTSFSGSVLTPYFLVGGMSESQISIYLSLLQVVNMIFPILIAGIASACTDSKRYAGVWYIIQALISSGFAVFCAIRVGAAIFFPMMLLIGSAAAMATAIQNVYHYKVPCEVIDLQYYSVYTARSGIFNGIVGILIGLLLPFLYARMDYMTVTGLSFLAASLLTAGAGVILFFMKRMHPVNEITEPQNAKPRIHLNPVNDLRRLLSHRDFRFLLIPNLARGFANGAMPLIAVIAMRLGTLNEGNAAMLTAAAQIGTLLSCVIYNQMVGKLGLPRTVLIGGVLMLFLPLCALGGTGWFLILYAIAYIGYYIISMAIPNMMYRAISDDIISIYNTWRLTLNTVGSVVSTVLFGFLLEIAAPIWLLCLGFVGYMICAVGHYLCYRNKI